MWGAATFRPWADTLDPGAVAQAGFVEVAHLIEHHVVSGHGMVARHGRVAQMARNGVKALGLSLFPDEKYASNTVTAVNATEKIDVPKLIQILRDDYEVVIAGGQQKLSGKIFRIGHLGLVHENDIKLVLDAIKKTLPKAKKG